MKTHVRPLLIAAALLFFACGGSSAARPETKLAGALADFQKSTREFTDARREIVRARQSLLDKTETDTSRTRFEADQALGVWRIADEKDKLELYERLLAATKATGDAGDALRELIESQKKALADANTKVELHQKELAAAIRALTTLGTTKSLEDRLKFYYEFLDETKKEVDERRGKVDQAKKSVAEGAR